MASSFVKPTLTFAFSASLLLFTTVLLYYFKASQRPRNFPPGPLTVPFLGNLHVLPKTKAFLKFHEWGKQYGGIIGLKLGPQNVVILNDYRHVRELFDKRGGTYSDRPPNHIANDLIFQNNVHILFLPYGDAWRLLRKTLQGLLNIKAVEAILPIQDAESTATSYQLLTNPDGWYDHIRRYSTAVILASVFGLRGSSFDSPRVRDLYHVQDQLTNITEFGATPPIDIFPWLKWLPDFMSPWRKWALSIRKEHRKFWFSLVEQSKQHMQRIQHSPQERPACFLQTLIAEQEKTGLDDEHVAYLCGTLMEAGSDTTSSTLLSFILALTKNPKVLQKCQEEVDKVCGSDRSPGINDNEQLTYIRATMNETLRWRPVAAGGIPHATTKDDWYQGYYIPRGTILFANTWSIHRTSDFANPDAFMPERFLNSKFGTDGTMPDDEDSAHQRRLQYGFGAGRRVCSGQRLAENSLMINMAKLVWGFDWTATTTSASAINDDVKSSYFGGFLICPQKFPVKFTVRSDRHAHVLRREYEEALPFLNQFGE